MPDSRPTSVDRSSASTASLSAPRSPAGSSACVGATDNAPLAGKLATSSVIIPRHRFSSGAERSKRSFDPYG
jgi:hypothetical protein